MLNDSNSHAFIGDRALATWEVVSVVSSVFIAEWMVASASGLSKSIVAIPITLAFLFMVFSHTTRTESFEQLGFRFDDFFRALKLLLLPMIAVAVILLIVGWRLGEKVDFLKWHGSRPLAVQLFVGFAWGLMQQYVLQGFVNRRLMLALGKGWGSILIVAAIFGCLHLPNVLATSITFMGGLIWATVYQRAPNLFALAASHSLMTWLLVSTLPDAILHHLRVGLGYFG